jgi:hypothetical protein
MVSKVTFVETQRQVAGIGVTQSLNVGITTTRVEMVIAPNMDVVRRGILIRFVTKLSNGLGGVSIGRNLNRSLALPTIITKVVGTPQMVFTNPIMTTHVNRIAN